MKNLFHDKTLLRNLLKQGDLLNTLNGGSSMTSVQTEKLDDQLNIRIKTPGVDVDSYTIMLVENKLTVTSLYGGKENNLEKSELPMKAAIFSRTFELPHLSDIDNIEALHENGELRIFVPFTEGEAQHRQRIIPIKNLN